MTTLHRYLLGANGQMIQPKEGHLLKIVEVPIQEHHVVYQPELRNVGRPYRDGKPA